MTPLFTQAPGQRLTAAEREQVKALTIPMLKAGATYAQITAEVGITSPTIHRIRLDAQLPATVHARPSRSIPDGLSLYTQPEPGGHLLWTGPMRGRAAALWAEGRVHNPRVLTFEAHRGRAPVGRLFKTCDAAGCIAGAHLSDARLRATLRRRES
jgi:hypothetical protein